MSVRRQLVNFGSTCTDFRIGCGAFSQLPQFIAKVSAVPKRAVLASDDLVDAEHLTEIRRALIDVGYTVHECSLAGEHAGSVRAACELFDQFAQAGMTADDMVVVAGGQEACSLAAFCSRTWCGGMSAVAIPFTLDAMCTVATSMEGLSVGGSPEMVSLQPGWDMVVCDLDLVIGKPVEQIGRGYTLLLGSALAESRRVWDAFPAKIDGMVAGSEISFIDALCNAQTCRAGAIRSANPSARNAMQYGTTTARALRACLGDTVPAYQLLAEGMRFEARVAHDACGLDVDIVFDQDDRLDDLGIEELGFELDVDTFLSALRAARFARSNRFMLALPKFPGSIRLSTVDDEVLKRHATAYLASRAELLAED